MQVFASLVRWDELIQALENGSAGEGFWQVDQKEEEPWVHYYGHRDGEDWADSYNLYLKAQTMLDRAVRNVDGETRTALRDFTLTFFGDHMGAGSARELHPLVTDRDDFDVFTITASPETIDRIQGMLDAGDRSSLEAAFRKSRVPRTYVEFWLSLLRRASQTRRGIVVSIC